MKIIWITENSLNCRTRIKMFLITTVLCKDIVQERVTLPFCKPKWSDMMYKTKYLLITNHFLLIA